MSVPFLLHRNTKIASSQAGKSSFVNSLLAKPLLPIYSLASSSLAPTTTSLPQEITLEESGKKIRLIDTPGLSWLAISDESVAEHESLRARDILLRNKGRIDRLKDPTFTCTFPFLSHLYHSNNLNWFYSNSRTHRLSRRHRRLDALLQSARICKRRHKRIFVWGCPFQRDD